MIHIQLIGNLQTFNIKPLKCPEHSGAARQDALFFSFFFFCRCVSLYFGCLCTNSVTACPANAPPSAFFLLSVPPTPAPVIIAFVTATITQICRGKIFFFDRHNKLTSLPDGVSALHLANSGDPTPLLTVSLSLPACLAL